MVAVITVVPGCSAVIVGCGLARVPGLMVAIEEDPVEKDGVPMEIEQEGRVADPGAQSGVCVPFRL